MRSGGKLFHLLRDVALPEYAIIDPALGQSHPSQQVLPALFVLTWPDGTPCLYAEMFLLEKSSQLTLRRNDGGSLKVAAADLSHLLRFCWHCGRNFWELDDHALREMIAWLQSARSANNPLAPQRNRNTINRIVAQTIEFLVWLQRRILPGRRLVGTQDQQAQITCAQTRSRRHNHRFASHLVFAFSLTADAPDPKRPISRELRQRLWTAVAMMADTATETASYGMRFPSRAAWLAERDYLRARRELMLALLEATGCRPGELTRLSVIENLICAATGKIVLTTLKRRQVHDPERHTPIARAIAMRLELFVRKSRAVLLDNLQQRGIAVTPSDSVFVCCRTGTPLTETSLTKDFQRIVRIADIEQRACMSMFRHRFITNMVALHLDAFVRESPGVERQYIMEADYRSILKRVAVFTGHGSVDSLFAYIDWAWEELGVFDHVGQARALTESVEDSLQRLSVLAGELEQHPQTAAKAIKVVKSELEAIRKRVHDAGKRA